MHCPSLPAIAHERQVPAHAVAQQTPVTQKPEAQSASAAQVAPGGFGPQLPFTHAAPHTPAPSQRPAWLTVDPEHDCARQIAPAGYSAQAPVPSQNPLRPQLARPSSGQSPRGSAPTGTLVQVPTLPTTVHD